MRDYEKDLVTCHKALAAKKGLGPAVELRPYLDFTYEALPWYIERCKDLEWQVAKLEQSRDICTECAFRIIEDALKGEK